MAESNLDGYGYLTRESKWEVAEGRAAQCNIDRVLLVVYEENGEDDLSLRRG